MKTMTKPMTDTTHNDTVRDLAHAMFMLTNKTEDKLARKAEWENTWPDHVALARKVLRRLDTKGYTLAKAS